MRFMKLRLCSLAFRDSRCLVFLYETAVYDNAGNTMLYWISYDLDKPGQDYTDLLNRLKQLKAVRILRSDWLLETTATTVETRDDLRQFMDGNDRVMVSQVSNNAAWDNLLVNDKTVETMYSRVG